jgi:hypothetical protein
MDAERNRPEGPQPMSPFDDATLQRWLEIRARLQQVHAELEFIRLMLRLQASA